MNPFQQKHFFQILSFWKRKQTPFDVWVKKYFSLHHCLGAKDRRLLRENLFALLRMNPSLSFLYPKASWEKKWEIFQNNTWKEGLAPHLQLGFPKWLYDKWVHQYGEEKTQAFCQILQQKAPVCIRVNPTKISREELLQKMKKKGHDLVLGKESPLAIYWLNPVHFGSLQEFQEGLFEVQDESTQRASLFVDPKPGETILDFCAGSGGKSLAMAPFLQGKGIICIHDKRSPILKQAFLRAKRLGLTSLSLFSFSGKPTVFDKLLLDVPCSGTGTLRRSPDQKERITPSWLELLQKQQQDIFAQSLPYVKPGGWIYYMSCSLLQEENEEQVENFTQNYPVKLKEKHTWFPKPMGGDGFFVAKLQRDL